MDASADQLFRARSRSTTVVRGDAAGVPLRDGCMDDVVAFWLSTDVNDFGLVTNEAARVLKAGGRFLVYGAHPCFNGPFVENLPDGSRVIHPGYRRASWHAASPWWSDDGVRSRVGMRHVPLADLLNNIANAGLDIIQAREPRAEPVPFILALLAAKPAAQR
jgi:SAM-dependent methyltransferase